MRKIYAGYGRNSFIKFLPNRVVAWFRHMKVQEIRIYMLFQPELRKKAPVEKRPGINSAYRVGKRGKTYAGYGRNSFIQFVAWFRHMEWRKREKHMPNTILYVFVQGGEMVYNKTNEAKRSA